jgi:cap1 methyltransferase
MTRLTFSILKCKTIFDRLEPAELQKARSRSNPFETIRGVFFLNRAAMKMANIDAVFDYMFTNPSQRPTKPTYLNLKYNLAKSNLTPINGPH